MRVTRSKPDDLPVPTSSYQTTFLWTEKGMLDTKTSMMTAYRSVDGALDMKLFQHTGSVSKVYHSEPATVTWYGKTMWREQTPTYDEVIKMDMHKTIDIQ